MAFTRTTKKCLLQNRSSESSTLIRMGWSATFAFSWWFRFGIKHRIFSQPGHHHGTDFDDRFQETGSGKATISNNPKLLSKVFTALLCPFRQFRCRFGFPVEGQSNVLDIVGFDVHPCQQGPADGSKGFVPGDRRQCDPDMAVNKLPPVRHGSGVAMNPCPHYLGTVAGCRAVINCHENRIRVFINSAYHYLKQCGRDIFQFLGPENR